MRPILALALLMTCSFGTRADDQDKKDKPTGDSPVTATLVATKSTYTLDFGSLSAEDYVKALKDTKGKYPDAPAVELTLELKNVSKNDVKIWISGDPVSTMLELKGPGAVSVEAQRIFTRIYYSPKAIDLPAGKTHEIKITSLQYGYRGVAKRAYWTEPGDYTLSAQFVTGISPAPEGVKPDNNGFGKTTLVAPEIKIKVEKK